MENGMLSFITTYKVRKIAACLHVTANIGCSMVGAGSGKREAEAEAGSDEVISDKILFYAE